MENLIKKLLKNKKLLIPICAVIVVALGIGGYFGYQYWQKHKTIEIPLSEAIELSKMDVFAEMELNTADIATFKVGEYIEREVTDIEGRQVKIDKDTDVQSKVGSLTLKDLQEMGMAVSKYRQVTGGMDWDRLLFPLIMIVFLVGLIYVMYNPTILSEGANKFKKGKENNITFADIGGCEDAKSELKEVIGFFSDREYLNKLGAKVPRGVLLSGVPGCGKTLLARATANEAGVQFFYATASEFQSFWYSMASMKIKRIFSEAKKKPSIIFIDEFESIAQARNFRGTDVARDNDLTINQLLSEMDGFKKDSNVVVIAATNHSEVLDPAVMRQGRFDRKITVSLPSLKERAEILSIHAKDKPISSNVNLESVAKQTGGLSGADLASILNESAIIAGREHVEKIDNSHINKAIDKVLAGSERKGLVLTQEDKKVVAYHEAGHALVSLLIPECDKVQRVTILPHGQAGGFTRTASEKENVLLSRAKALAMISMYLGGRIAEEVAIGDVSSGAQNDLQQANLMASEMVKHLGMGKDYGIRFWQDKGVFAQQEAVSDGVAKMIDDDVKGILDECYEKAKGLIIEKGDKLGILAEKLMVLETMSGEEVEEIMVEHK